MGLLLAEETSPLRDPEFRDRLLRSAEHWDDPWVHIALGTVLFLVLGGSTLYICWRLVRGRTWFDLQSEKLDLLGKKLDVLAEKLDALAKDRETKT